MATVYVFVATRRFASEREMDEFIDPTFTQDGDIVPSRFMREVELGGYEPGCIEAVHDADEKLVGDLLHDVSYAEQWVHLVEPTVLASEAICVFEPNTVKRPEGTSLRYCGAFSYRTQ